MATFRVSPKQLDRAIDNKIKSLGRALGRATLSGARKGKTHLQNQAEIRGIVDRGLYKRSWRVFRTVIGQTPKGRRKFGFPVNIYNGTPYAGIIERGARPHPVSFEGFKRIEAWARRKLRGTDRKGRKARARAIAIAIVEKIRRHGQKGTHVVENSIPKIIQLVQADIKREFRREANRPPRRGRGR